jgi:hypothetical protein
MNDMSGKTVMFSVTTNGSGTHMIREIFVSMGFKHLGTNPMRLWPIFVKASADPNGTCHPLLVGKGKNLTNEEALRDLYGSWGYHPDADELHSEALAKQLFGEILCQKIPDQNLLITHDYIYIHGMKLDYDSSYLSWSQEESDQAFGLLVDSLAEAPLKAKYLTVVRHPLFLYQSVLERGGLVSDSRMGRILGFFRRVDGVKADDSLDRYFLKYEDLCSEPDRCVREITDWTFPDGDAGQKEAMWQKAHQIPQQRPAGAQPQDDGNIDLSQLAELATRYDYGLIEQTGSNFWARTKLARYFYDVGLVVKLISGSLTSSAALRHHKLTIPASMLLRVLRRVPGLSHRWNQIADSATDNLGTGVDAPEAWSTAGNP